MVRLLYISGMVFFTVLVGDAGSRLWELYGEGNLFDQYNSERKAAITLLAVSGCGLGTLCMIELVRIRRRYARHDPLPAMKDDEPVADEPCSTSIYAAPHTVDEWQDRRQRLTMVTSSRRQALPALQSLNMTNMWMSILRIYCAVLPVIYTYTMLNYLFIWLPDGAGHIAFSILFPMLLLGSVLTSVGLLRKKKWGIKVGYAMAIFHLLIFPLGTAAGFVMLIALVGTTSEFEVPKRRRRRIVRKAKRKNLHSTAV